MGNMKCPLCKKKFERAECNIWGKRFCPYCNFDLGVDIEWINSCVGIMVLELLCLLLFL